MSETGPTALPSKARPFSILVSATSTAALLISLGCSSLTVSKPTRRAQSPVELPEIWINSGTGTDGEISTGWLSEFGDPDMERLVYEALENNPDIQRLEWSLNIAADAIIQSRSALIPSVSAGTSGSTSGVRNRDAAGDLQPWRHSESYGANLNTSWEIDLWGRLRNLNRAVKRDYEATVADFRAARLSLAANTASAWFNLIAAGQQLELAKKTRASFERNYRITERTYRAGDTTAIDVQFGRNNVASAERSVISRQLQVDEAKRTLEVLLGRYPAAEIENRPTLPTLAEAVPTGLPSELLMRRPDLIATAADLEASAERADAARKNLLPSINLSSRGSASSEQLTDLVANPSAIAWNVAASLGQPIFRGGALRAQARQAQARNEAAIQTFSANALRAFREVESGLARDYSLAEQEEFLQIELAQANLAETQSARDYSEGIVGILSVLEAQRRAFNARNAMISLRNQRLQNRIDLHLSLGGNFATLPSSLEE